MSAIGKSYRKIQRRAFGAAAAAALAGCSNAHAHTELSTGTELAIFDCYVPLPTGFVLATKEKYVSFFQRSPVDITRVKVHDYPVEAVERLFVVERSEIFGPGVRMDWLRSRKPGDNAVRAVMMTDEKKALLVLEPSKELIDFMVNGCIRSLVMERGR